MFISVDDTPSLTGKATRTDGWGTDFSEIICWSNHGIGMDALFFSFFRHILFFLSFPVVGIFLCYLHTHKVNACGDFLFL